MRRYVSICVMVLALAAALGGLGARAATNIVSSPTTSRWGWNDIVGWIDFYADPSTNAVNVSGSGLSGYASSSVGQLSLDCATSPAGNICSGGNGNYQVLNDGAGNLSGWAWNDVVGWVSFCGGQSSTNCPGTVSYRVLINGTTGDFTGWAWNDAVGWISFNCLDVGGQSFCDNTSNYKLDTDWTSTSTTGYVDSATFDTGVSGGAQINSILWYGSLPSPANGSYVTFQIAVSSTASASGWNFVGPDGTSSTYYPASGVSSPGSSIPLSYTLHNNNRYFRYRMYLSSTLTQSASPRVDSVGVNWSR